MMGEPSGEHNYDAAASWGGSNGKSGAAGSAGSSQGQGGGMSMGGGAGFAGSSNADASFSDSMPPPADAAEQADAAQDAAQDAPLDVLEADVDTCAALDQSKPQVIYQSADDSNSMASPVYARKLINAGMQVPIEVLRTYEFLNYYNVHYDFAPQGHVRVVPQMRPGKLQGEYFLQVGIQSEQAQSPRRAMNITFILDNTGSMAGESLAAEKATVLAIASQMKPGDIVSMIAFNTSQWTLLDNHVATGASDPEVLAAANQLYADGSTDLHGGLVAGYAAAKKQYKPQLMNRVVLVTDGGANVGVVDADMIAVESHNADGEGIYLVGIAVGPNVNEELMNTVTDKGRGAYLYLDNDAEAQKMFGSRFDEVMEVAVRDIRLELTVPWYFTLKSTSAEQSSTNPEEVDPQYLSPSDAIVLHNTFLPCSPAQWNPADPIQAKATYRRPITQEPGEDVVQTTIGELLQGSAEQLKKGTAIVAYAEALKKVMKVYQPNEKTAALDEALAAVAEADPNSTDADLVEIKTLLNKYKSQF
jgi:Ca-activated chloride channel homolog